MENLTEKECIHDGKPEDRKGGNKISTAGRSSKNLSFKYGRHRHIWRCCLAGGGKTYALLLEPLRHLNNPQFGGIIFRRTTKQIKTEGSLWDTSENIYTFVGADARKSRLEWQVADGWKMQFAHLEYEKNVYDYQGAQIPFIGFEELTHFTKKQFFYMISRARSMSGIPGYIRATCNPDANSWVASFIEWWIDQESGKAITERSGIIRWFINIDGSLKWADSKEELKEIYGPDAEPLSVTFIKSTVYDNKILLDSDPTYLAKLKALDKVERERLLEGNWKIVASAGVLFKRHYFEIVDAFPSEITKTVRCWDRAATKVDETNKDKIDPDYTVGVKLAKTRQGIFYVLDVVRERESPFEVERITVNTAKQDGVGTEIKIFQDPGSAGVYEAKSYIKKLAGFIVHSEKIITNKLTNAKPVSAQAEAGNIKVLRAEWNNDFFDELENFPDGTHDDQVDALSGAFNMLTSDITGDMTEEFYNEDSISNLSDRGNPQW